LFCVGRLLISPSFCRFVPADLLKPQSGKILSLLLPLLEQATGETLYLLLETIRAVLALDQTLLTPQSVGPVADTVYAVWEKYNTGESVSIKRFLSFYPGTLGVSPTPDPVLTPLLGFELSDTCTVRTCSC
jgi:hypothetical protein